MAAPTPRLRPKDAATLILVRERREILMGLRSPGHAFLPNRFVFPGGRVDAADMRMPAASGFRPEVVRKLAYRTRRRRLDAFGLAAIRETFEETGLRLGRPGKPDLHRPLPAQWEAFCSGGIVPALDILDYIARAITPPFRPRRFDARFFVADATHAHGELTGNGELLELHWVPLEATRELELPRVTRIVIDLLAEHLRSGTDAGNRKIPLIRFRRGEYVFDYH